MTIQRVSFITTFSAGILVELVVFAGLGVVTMQKTGLLEENPWLWFGIALVVALVMHLTASRLLESWRIRDASVRAQGNVWTALENAGEWGRFLRSILLLAVGIAGGVALGIFVQKQWLRGELIFSAPSGGYVSGFVAYWLVVLPVWLLCRGKQTSAGFQCALDGSTILFSLAVGGGRSCSFEVGTGEITELRLFENYAESRAFFQRNIASNVPLVACSTVDRVKWYAGKIARPRGYFISPSVGPIFCYIQGPGLTLFIPIATESLDVLRPFETPSGLHTESTPNLR